ncbi:MAG TPA: HAD family acid phosphatase [Mycobacteriales bacterium]|nr:HAD family acid phosphatase [Mycobacteriales bacterium]
MRVPAFRSSRRRLAVGAAAAAVAVALAGGAVANAAMNQAPAGPHLTDRNVPNLTKVEDKIKAYYGDHVVDGEHYASPDSDYARQVHSIESQLKNYLRGRLAEPPHGKPAIVLDVDDTTLLTYNYELEVNFAYTPESNAAYVEAEKMSAVYGMPQLVSWASEHGVALFYVTGRPESQRDATVGNLAKVGYAAPAADHLFLKNADNPPAYLPCGATCTTIQYKSGTRAYLQQQGYDILASVGDQYSDLQGGHRDHAVKMPNPMYFLP